MHFPKSVCTSVNETICHGIPDQRPLEDGDIVVILGQLTLRARATGEEWTNPFCQVDKVDREKGLITEIRPFYWDVARLNRAVGKK